jgi:hypothetical protein
MCGGVGFSGIARIGPGTDGGHADNVFNLAW